MQAGFLHFLWAEKRRFVVRIILLSAFLPACHQAESARNNGIKVSVVPPQVTPSAVKFVQPTPHKAGVPLVRRAGKPQSKPAGFFVSMTNYNSDQGLTLSSVRSACTDKSGKLWFGTLGGGVSRYDGKTFTNYTTREGLANNDVYSILEDKHGNLWFATYGGGVSRYDGKRFTTFNTQNGLAGNTVFSILEDSHGNLWFGTIGGGLSCYDGKSFTTINAKNGLVSDSILSIGEDGNGNLWFGSNGSGLSCYHPIRDALSRPASRVDFTTYTMADGLAQNSIYSILADHAGNLWFGTDKGGVSTCRPVSGKSKAVFTNFTTREGLCSNSVMSILEDDFGFLWFATDGGGVSRYGPSDPKPAEHQGAIQKSFTTFSVSEGLAGNQVFCMNADKSGNIYFGTGGEGISRYDGRAFRSYTAREGLPNLTVFAVFEDHTGIFWFGTYEGGLCRYDGKSFTSFTLADGLASNQVSCIFEDLNNILWVCTYGGGVSRYDGKSFTNYSTREGLVNNTVSCGLQARDSSFWFGTSGAGVSHFDGKQFTNYNTNQGLAGNTITSIMEDKQGKLWFSSLGKGVSCLDPHSPEQRFINFTTHEGLADNSVYSMLQDKGGNYWFGTYGGGLSRFDGKQFVNYTTSVGLGDDVIYDILEDHNNMIWFGTNAGFTGLKGFVKTKPGINLQDPDKMVPAAVNMGGAELAQNYKPVFEIFNQTTGYPVKDINTNAMFCDHEGTIWAGTGDRLIRFDYSGIRKNANPPHLIIQAVRVQGENVGWYDILASRQRPKSGDTASHAQLAEEVGLYGHALSPESRDSMTAKFGDLRFDTISAFYPIPSSLVLPFRHNHLTIDFTAIEPACPYLVKYSYLLRGYEDEWSLPGTKSNASFGNIHEGSYVFLVKAQNHEGVWSAPVSFSFTVLPPWYRTWWAWCLEALFVFGLIALVFRWRTGTLRRVNEKLEQTVKDRTAFIEQQHREIEDKNQRITDSIAYAKHIQDSMMQNEEEVNKLLGDFFIYHRPKDIVSGDFYWFSEQGDKTIIAVADCTGHGVPGAFMTVIGTMLLLEVVNEKGITDPGLILEAMHNGIEKVLRQQKSSDQAQDGMDISICVVDKTKQTFSFSGAKNSLYIFCGYDLEVVKGGMRGVGGRRTVAEETRGRVFTTHKIPYAPGTKLYMFTDGYRDQYQGVTKEKFGSSRFKDLLLEINNLPMPEQRNRIHTCMEEWRTTRPQIDDILVIGIAL